MRCDDYDCDSTDVDPVTYRECRECSATLRGSGPCRRCGPLKRMLDRIAGIQLEAKLLNSLAVCAEERGAFALGREHVRQAQALLRVCNVWLSAARQYESRERGAA